MSLKAQCEVNQVNHEAAGRKLVDTVNTGPLNVRRIKGDTKSAEVTMYAVTRSHVDYVQSVRGSVTSVENSNWMKVIKIMNNDAKNKAEERLLKGAIMALVTNLKTLVDAQMTLAQYEEAGSMVAEGPVMSQVVCLLGTKSVITTYYNRGKSARIGFHNKTHDMLHTHLFHIRAL